MTRLAEIRQFIEREADMLDFREYREWLDLWVEDGLYVVPVDAEGEDYENRLNFAYDKAEMRRLRVERLLSGDAVSTETTSKTVRSVSRLRILSEAGEETELRCAQFIAENRHGNLRIYPADVTFRLRRVGDGYRIVKKVVRLLHAEHALSSIGYIL